MASAANTSVVRVTREQLGITTISQYDGPVEYDLGNMAAFAPSPADQSALTSSTTRDAACTRLAQLLTQGLVAELFALPTVPTPGVQGRIVALPSPTTKLPRAKPIPKPRPPTRWEQFAAKKGIQKRKRSKLEWDDTAGEWRRRHGYKRVNDPNDVPVIEASSKDQVGDDPFTAGMHEKKERIAKQEKRRLANLKAAAKAAGTEALPPTLKLAASLPQHGKGRPVKRKELKYDITAASRQAGVSTASMGKFDVRLKGEKPNERRLPGSGPKPLQMGTQERTVTAKLADKIVRQRADDIVDVDRAAGQLEAQRRAQRHADKKNSGSGGGGQKGKSGEKQRGKKFGAGGTKKGQKFAESKGGPRAAGTKGGVGKKQARGRGKK